MPGLDPISLIPSGVQTVGGIFQSIFGGIKAHKANKALENLKTPTYNANKSIMDYYNTALQRYNTNPYQSQQYQYDINKGNANLGAGLNALQDRRSAIGGISRLTALGNENSLRAGMNAENTQNQRFGQLGGATEMKASDDRYGFNVNKLMPYQKQYDLLASKSAAGNQMLNAGIQNAFGGISGGSQITSDYLNNRNGGNGYTDYFNQRSNAATNNPY